MKKIILFFLTITCLAISCTKVEDPEGYKKLQVFSPGDTIIVNYGTVIKFSTVPIGLFEVSKPEAGTVDYSGLYTAGNTQGTYQLVVLNSKDIRDTVKKTIIVTPHASIFNAMKLTGGYLFSFRHADATSGADDISSNVVSWWKSADPRLAAQITNPIGIKNSDSTGMVMRMMKLPFDTTMSSEFARCKQTIQHFNLNLPNKEYTQLTYYVYNEPLRYANTLDLFATKPIALKNYLAVTHAEFANPFSAANLHNLGYGDCAVYKMNSIGVRPTFVKKITVSDWLAMARK